MGPIHVVKLPDGRPFDQDALARLGSFLENHALVYMQQPDEGWVFASTAELAELLPSYRRRGYASVGTAWLRVTPTRLILGATLSVDSDSVLAEIARFAVDELGCVVDGEVPAVTSPEAIVAFAESYGAHDDAP